MPVGRPGNTTESYLRPFRVGDTHWQTNICCLSIRCQRPFVPAKLLLLLFFGLSYTAPPQLTRLGPIFVLPPFFCLPDRRPNLLCRGRAAARRTGGVLRRPPSKTFCFPSLGGLSPPAERGPSCLPPATGNGRLTFSVSRQ